jgi:hypothetical protein
LKDLTTRVTSMVERPVTCKDTLDVMSSLPLSDHNSTRYTVRDAADAEEFGLTVAHIADSGVFAVSNEAVTTVAPRPGAHLRRLGRRW